MIKREKRRREIKRNYFQKIGLKIGRRLRVGEVAGFIIGFVAMAFTIIFVLYVVSFFAVAIM